MKKIYSLLVLIVALIFVPSHGNCTEPAFAIFVSLDETRSLQQMSLSREPFITDVDIIEYDWQTHEILLTKQGVRRLQSLIESRPEGKLFVVVSDEIRCYSGAFWKGIYSAIYANPVILIDSPSQDRIKIERAYPSGKFASGKDPRSDKRIYDALKRVRKLVESR